MERGQRKNCLMRKEAQGQVGQRRRTSVKGVFMTVVGILITTADITKRSFKRMAKCRFGEGLEVERESGSWCHAERTGPQGQGGYRVQVGGRAGFSGRKARAGS